MSSQADTLLDAPLPAEAVSTSAISPVQLFLWSVRRELWDNHSLFIAPGAVAALLSAAFMYAFAHFKDPRIVDGTPTAQGRITATGPYDMAFGLLMTTALIVGVFFSIDALYAERRDRSILFWRSLPVSDLTTVLAKAGIPLFVLPFITFVLTVCTHLLMITYSSIVLWKSGVSAAPLWAAVALPHRWLLLLAHVFAVSALWYAPFYAWLLLVSAWAPRTPLLWAFLPPLAAAAIETTVLHTSYIGYALRARLAHGNITLGGIPSLSGANTPELWLGLAVAAALLAATIQVRKFKGAL